MSKFERIDLKGIVPSCNWDTGSITYLYAEVCAEDIVPFAIVFYSEDHEAREEGLRLDMDKVVFLDHFENESKEAALRESAKIVTNVILDKMSKMHWLRELLFQESK